MRRCGCRCRRRGDAHRRSRRRRGAGGDGGEAVKGCTTRTRCPPGVAAHTEESVDDAVVTAGAGPGHQETFVPRGPDMDHARENPGMHSPDQIARQ